MSLLERIQHARSVLMDLNLSVAQHNALDALLADAEVVEVDAQQLRAALRIATDHVVDGTKPTSREEWRVLDDAMAGPLIAMSGVWEALRSPVVDQLHQSEVSAAALRSALLTAERELETLYGSKADHADAPMWRERPPYQKIQEALRSDAGKWFLQEKENWEHHTRRLQNQLTRAHRHEQDLVKRMREAEERWRQAQNQSAAAIEALILLADSDPELTIPSGALSPRKRPPSFVIERLERIIVVARMLIAGLKGTPFAWRGVDVQHYRPLARLFGLTLVSKSRVAALNWKLKKNVQPVGEMYYGAPISRWADVYILEAQAEPLPVEKPEDTANHE